jgi:polyisoprenoid-binding protein YceI
MATRWELDTNHTRLGFSAKHLMVTTVRGGFGDFAGFIEIDGDDESTAKGEVVINTASVGSGVEDRDNHLRSADFFDVENYPQMKFVSTRVEKVGNDKYKVFGDLTIKDVTRPVELDAEIEGRINDPWGNERVGLSASTKINRKDWGLTWNMAIEAGGVVVSDQIKIEVEAALTAQLQAAA